MNADELKGYIIGATQKPEILWGGKTIDYILKDGEINSKYLLKNFGDTYIDSPSVYEPGNIYFYGRGNNAKAPTFNDGIITFNSQGTNSHAFISYPICIGNGKKLFAHAIASTSTHTTTNSFIQIGFGKLENSNIQNNLSGLLSKPTYGSQGTTSAWIATDISDDADFMTFWYCDCVYSIDEIIVIDV
jgi:hypothetical protein